LEQPPDGIWLCPACLAAGIDIIKLRTSTSQLNDISCGVEDIKTCCCATTVEMGGTPSV
jgi:hypothetical protein